MPEMAAPLGVGEIGEATTIAGSVLSQIINTVRTIVAYVMEILRRVYTWIGEHPLAFSLAMINLVILIAG